MVPETTSSMACLRWHRGNAENWLNHATPRYDYLYSPAELRAFVHAAGD